jgi:hypothetical protein
MEEVQYSGEDNATEIGNLSDIQVRHPLFNQDVPRKEIIEFTEFDFVNEPKDGNGNAAAKGVKLLATIRVVSGTNEGEEFTQPVPADRRVRVGKKQSAYRSMLLPFVYGAAECILGKDNTLFIGAVQSNETYLEDITARLQSLIGKRGVAMIGIEKGQKGKSADGEDIQYRDKQVVTAWYPKQA